MNVAILTGGMSSEREIALKSAQHVAAALQGENVRVFDFPKDLDLFLAMRRDFSVAIPVFHGRGGEDGEVQGFLRTLGVPFVFSDVAAHALAMDKDRTKIVVAAQGVRVPAGRVISRGESFSFLESVVVKPVDAGSSVGVAIAHSQDDVDAALRNAFVSSSSVLVETYIRGQEFTIPVIDRGGIAQALPVIQITSKHAFFDLESKYDPSLSEEVCPAPISADLAAQLQDVALRAHRAVGARHLSRTDVIVDPEGRLWFLEINTIPGMTQASLFPKSIDAAGLSFGVLLREWIREVAPMASS